jgi:putative ABC transport system permease protein
MKYYAQLQLSFKLFIRELKSMPVLLWISSLFFASVVCTALIGMTENLKNSLSKNTSELVGGDLVVSSYRPLPSLFYDAADALTLEYVESVNFFSMVQLNDSFSLASIKAVSDQYPLYGQLRIQSDGNSQYKSKGPSESNVWVSTRLSEELKIKPGNTIQIGLASLMVEAIIEHEPDTAGGLDVFAPRVLMHIKDIAQTAVVQPGSRIEYKLYLKGESSKIKQYIDKTKAGINPDIQLSNPHSSNMAFKAFWKNAGSLTSIAILSTLMLTGFSVLMATRSYAKSHRQHVLLLKTLGTKGKDIGRIFALNFTWISLSPLLAGVSFGYIILMIFDAKITYMPGLMSMALGLGIVFAFGFPILNRLKDISPMQILQQNTDLNLSLELIPIVGLFGILVFGLYLYTGQINILAIVGLALLYAGIGIWVLLLALSTLLRMILPYIQGIWRLGMRNMLARRSENILQVLVFTFIFTLVGLNYGLLYETLNKWVGQLPSDTANYFILNIAPKHVGEIKQKLERDEVNSVELYAIVRGRLTHINAQPTTAIQRALNLTSMLALPSDNQILNGIDWAERPRNGISVESTIARRLKLKLGDILRFKIENSQVEGTVVQIREVTWENFKPNFYFIFDPNQLEPYSSTAMTSFYLPEDKQHLILDLINEFPEISVIDIRHVIAGIESMMSKLVQGLSVLLVAMCTIGMCAWLGNLWLALRAREGEQALLAALGAKYTTLLKLNLLEFGCYGTLVGLLSVSLSNLICSYISINFLNLTFEWLTVTTIVQFVLIILIFLGVGIIFSKRIQSVSPLSLLNK